MKSTKEYFPVIMLITLYKVALTYQSVDEILSVTIQMKATKQYFLEALFISIYFVVFDSFPVQGCPYVWVWTKRWCITFQMKATEQLLPVELFITPYKDCPNFWVCGRNL